MRKGVCQDYPHITIILARQLGIPCRYVSGYLYQPGRSQDRSTGEATHAWVEAYLPGLGWIGFDPTNNTTTDERHIRVAIGRDYADVPPTRGVYRGKAESELAVTVRITPSQTAIHDELPVEPPTSIAVLPGEVTVHELTCLFTSLHSVPVGHAEGDRCEENLVS